MALGVIAAGGCWPAQPPAQVEGEGVALDRLAPSLLRLPADNRDGRPPAETIAVSTWARSEDGAHSAPLPLRPRGLFPGRPPTDLVVATPDGSTVPTCDPAPPPCWGVSAHRIFYRPDPDAGWPEGLLELRSPEAASRERRLNRAQSGAEDDAAFAPFRLWSDHTSRPGLLLGAPAEVAWDLTAPPASDLRLTALLVPPEWADGPTSDGATVRVAIETDGIERATWSTEVVPGSERTATLALDRWAGQRIRVRVQTSPGATSHGDYVFIAEPAVTPRRARPRRIVLAFIDTLRADATTVDDPALATTPHLAKIAAAGSAFRNAHSVAPWTLPAWRAAITGRLPTDWAEATPIAEALSARGWATAMFAGNVYLSASFDGDRGFGLHRTRLSPSAEEQVDDALAWLAAHPDRDAMMVVHFMDPHLPYEEPDSHRRLFAGNAPDGWPDAFTRLEALSFDPGPAERDWIRGRYHNNVRYVDDALARLDAALGAQDLLVVFSDHGEEFWDHGGFEHGHTLESELTRVPLVLRGPGVPIGTFDHPVSLLDIAPTVLAWAGLPTEALDGRDLFTPPEDGRPLPLGHPLYGHERWGVATSEGHLSTLAGRAEVVRRSDGEERRDPPGADRAAWLDRLSRAHRAEVAPAIRVAAIALPGASDASVRVTIEAEGGFAAPTPAATPLPTDRLDASMAANLAAIIVPAGWRGAHELMLVPASAEVELTLTVTAADGTKQVVRTPWPPANPDEDTPWLEREVDGLRIIVGPGLAVRPGATPIPGFHPAQVDALRALGYVEP